MFSKSHVVRCGFAFSVVFLKIDTSCASRQQTVTNDYKRLITG